LSIFISHLDSNKAQLNLRYALTIQTILIYGVKNAFNSS
ncbi:MAG: hypothetical protein ACI8UC_001878, partial [Psychromonas sp.]